MREYRDIADFKEDDRIDQIGRQAMLGDVVGFVTDTEGPDGYEKLDRYIAKLKKKFPALKIEYRGVRPVANTMMGRISIPKG